MGEDGNRMFCLFLYFFIYSFNHHAPPESNFPFILMLQRNSGLLKRLGLNV